MRQKMMDWMDEVKAEWEGRTDRELNRLCMYRNRYQLTVRVVMHACQRKKG